MPSPLSGSAFSGPCPLPEPSAAAEAPVRFLIDENLSASLVRALAGEFPGSVHVLDVGLGGADDEAVWAQAATGGFVLLTKDDDFHRLSVMHGAPPKVVCLTLGNRPTRAVLQVLQVRADEIRAFVAHEEATFLALR